MARAPLALLAALFCSAAFAQADAGVSPSVPTDFETLRRELEAMRKEISDLKAERRAQTATEAVAPSWTEQWAEEKRKLELFVANGYFRVRPELFTNLNLNRADDPSGYSFVPRSPVSARDRTMAGVNMRFRFEPTLNVSEQVRVRAQIDALDNVIFGSSPDYAYSRNAASGWAYDRDVFSILSQSQSTQKSGLTALSDSIAVKRVWGEVETPVGILRFGRMGSQWGLGMLHNDGNCQDCDTGDTVDRLMFVAQPIGQLYIAPAFDFNAEGPSTARALTGGQPIDLTNSDDTHSFVVAVAWRDLEEQARAKIDAGGTVLNGGVHFTYRWGRNDSTDLYLAPFADEGSGGLGPSLTGGFVQRLGFLIVPDIWVKLERKDFRLEFEAAMMYGTLANRALSSATASIAGQNQALTILQFGAVLQGEYRLLGGALQIMAEVGFASGDSAPGMGNYQRRTTKDADGNTQPGDIDGRQFACQSTGGCTDSQIKNFRFNRDYRVDSILFREILGGVTDSLYVKPTLRYRITDGLFVFGSALYSRAIFPESTPSARYVTDSAGNVTVQADANLGIELSAGARYETEDGLFGQVSYGVVFPLGGLYDNRPAATGISVEASQAIRGTIGIHF